ncbi:MAG: hypothetical protein GX591_03060 [Planctomycetes bacterium]|nr:hypothetical protein [Planctomycetota bacterium]
MTDARHPSPHAHVHGAGVRLEPPAHAILVRGLTDLLAAAGGLGFGPTASQRHPLPLAELVYGTVPPPVRVAADVRARLESDPVSVLEQALVLVELIESNAPEAGAFILEDMPFVRACFRSKRLNGWIGAMGRGDREALEGAINGRWQFEFVHGPDRPTGVYALLNRLARYAFVYGRIAPGDAHAGAHFIEDFCPGLLICRGAMTDLELALSLAAMKMGVPAIVPADYPFPLGRTVRTDRLDETVAAVTALPNIRRLLTTPDIARLPEYCDSQYASEKIIPAATWGGTAESFYVVRKGRVDTPGAAVVGEPEGPMGVVVTIDGEPLDALDLQHIEGTIAGRLATMKGVGVRRSGSDLRIDLAEGVDLDPARIGEVLVAAVRQEFPRLQAVRAEVIFDVARLRAEAPAAAQAKRQRDEAVRLATEESATAFSACVGCSPFAPDHVCVLTPQRPPQCGRPLGMIQTGARYGYDDMTNIHHSRLHREVNSFQMIDKGRCLDPVRGEWSGVNQAVARLSRGRTTRVQLHCLDEVPHTGCGCFRLILFLTDTPRRGVGIMDAGYAGAAPDGRRWADLHYALAGKQTPGVAGAAPNYLRSGKFLQGHGGWSAVVWVSPAIAAVMGADIPAGVGIGAEAEAC